MINSTSNATSSHSNSTAAVQTKGLTKTYKTTNAVQSIDITVPAGCHCGFLGKNGAGKTTTMKMLTGLIRPTSGEIQMMGEPRHFGQGGSVNLFGYLPDVPDYYHYMTAREFLTLCANICKIPKAEADQRITHLLKTVGLDRTRAKTGGFSRGMRQRLGIAQALITNPKIVFMDEPMSALDPMGRRDVAEIIAGLKDTTVVFSTHILADVENVCNYILIIEKGQIVAQDTMENLRAKHATNALRLKFFSPEGAQAFVEKSTDGFSLEALENPLEVLVRHSGNTQEISLRTMAAAANLGIAIETLEAHTPTLEDIFYTSIKEAK